jgi:TRAP-type C4-dicarboxylate transport system permease small subunit
MSSESANRNQPATLKWVVGPLDLLTRISFNLGGAALAVMLFLIVQEVIKRYFFNAPTNWSNDLNQWLFALTVMLVLPELARSNGNVAITILIERLSHGKGEVLLRVIAVICSLICLLVCHITLMETVRQYHRGISTLWINPIPKWWISAVIPFGFGLSALQFLRLGLLPASTPADEIEESCSWNGE